MMVKELRRKGVTLQLLWEEYLREHPDGYQNSQFCHHFHRWRKSAEVSMHIDHKAGEKLFVDYAGDKLAIVDRDSGKEQPVETFVAILAASELTYVEASASQQSDDWIRSNERALRYCGGCTQVIIPDNLRSAVSRSDPYEPGINSTYDAFAGHYGVVIMPARVRQARDKALVESAVRLTNQRIYAPLRDRTFHSLEELNAAIRPLLEQHNRRRFQRLPYSRVGYHASSRLFGELRLAKADGSYVRELEKISKQALLIIDLSRPRNYPDARYLWGWDVVWGRAAAAGCRADGRDNHRASRKASSRSDGRNRPARDVGGVVRASARSLIVMSACK